MATLFIRDVPEKVVKSLERMSRKHFKNPKAKATPYARYHLIKLTAKEIEQRENGNPSKD